MSEKLISSKITYFFSFALIFVGSCFLPIREYESSTVQMLITALYALFIVAYCVFERRAIIKAFEGKEYEKVEVMDKYVKVLMIVLAIIILIPILLSIIFSEMELGIPLVLVMLVFYNIFNSVIYISEDKLIYNNTVLYIDKIEKEDKVLGFHLLCNRKGVTVRVKVGSMNPRNRIFTIINDRIQMREA
jgi:amino acid transporter